MTVALSTEGQDKSWKSTLLRKDVIRTVPNQQAPNRRLKTPGSLARAGLAPLEFTLALPILLFVMALMIIAGTTAAWKARTDANSRQTTFRAILPRTGSEDENPRGWPQEAQMRLDGNGDGFIESDPYQPHEVVRADRLAAPTGESVDVLQEALDTTNEILLGVAEIQRRYPMMANMRPEGIHPIREYPLLNGDWRFSTIRNPNDGRGIGSNVARRVPHMYPSDFEGQLASEISEYQDRAIDLISDPDGPTIDLLDQDEELAYPFPQGTEYEPPYGIGRSPNYFLPENRTTLRNLTQPHRLCTYDPQRLYNELGAALEGEIRNVPQRITRDHLRMYQTHLSHIERLLEMLEDPASLPPDLLAYLQSKQPEMEANKPILEDYIDELESFRDSL